MDNTETPLKANVLSLCTGYGGIERGLELTGIRTRIVTHVEIEAFAIANLVAKMETGEMGWAPIWTNVKTLPLEPFRGKVDILTGGYPCQPFSQAGQQLGEKDPRHLWPWILRIIDGVMPRLCFFENVEGHINKGLRTVLNDLEERGYKTAWGIFSAREVGAPHQRKRVFIMAYRNDLRPGRWPAMDACGINGSGLQTPEEGEGAHDLRGQAAGRSGSGGSLADSPRSKAELDNSECQRLEGQSGTGNDPEGRQDKNRSASPSSFQWPGRPGESQHAWEPSRVTAKSGLGGIPHGRPHRVDRLRLLGNGVVPQTAAKAFIKLLEVCLQ